jgi:TolB-like protein
MKRFFMLILTAVLFASCASAPSGGTDAPADAVTLDEAIAQAATNIEDKLEPGTSVVVLSFQSASGGLSSYVLEELSNTLVNGAMLKVVDRANLASVFEELKFNESGNVSDKTAQQAGKMVGAQTIVTGSISPMGKTLRLRFKTIETEAAQILASSSVNVVNDENVAYLLLQGDGGTQGGSGTQAASGGKAATQAAKPAGPANGTYTFWPRPRASEAGEAVNVYIAQMVYTEDYTVIHFARQPEGDFSNGISGTGWGEEIKKVTLQDLDNPSKFYTPVSSKYTNNGMGDTWSLSFNRLTAKRFKLVSENWAFRSSDKKQTFYEVVIPGEPDAE